MRSARAQGEHVARICQCAESCVAEGEEIGNLPSAIHVEGEDGREIRCERAEHDFAFLFQNLKHPCGSCEHLKLAGEEARDEFGMHERGEPDLPGDAAGITRGLQ
jgi:hypothetical protein